MAPRRCRKRFASWLVSLALVLIPAIMSGSAQTVAGKTNPTDAVKSVTDQPSNIDGALLLERAITAAGGRQAWKEMTGFRASGELSLYSGHEISQTGRAVVAGNGLTQFKLTADLPNETRRWILNNGQGALTAQNVTVPIGGHNLPALEGITLPIEKLIELLNGGSARFIESTDLEGRPTYRLRVTRSLASPKATPRTQRLEVDTDVLVDSENFTILAIEDTIFPNSHTRDRYPHRILYGDYRPIAGVSIPFSIKEEISGQLTWGLQLDSFQPNAAMSNADFELK